MKSPAFQWYPKDILSSHRVAIMSLQEEGAYRRALDFCWLHGYIPSDLKQLCRMIGKGCSKKIAEKVKEMFVEMPGHPTRLIHERLDEERKKQQSFREKQRENGKHGGRPKKVNPETAKGLGLFDETQTKAKNNSAVSGLHFSSANNNNNNNNNEGLAKRLLSNEGGYEREQIRISTKKQIDEEILREFLAHLSLETIQHQTISDFNVHLRNWLNTRPDISQKNSLKNQSHGNNHPPKQGTKLGRISESALNQFLHRSDTGH